MAKGKLSTPVFGIALGVPLGQVSVGPFYQFQNMEDSEADLTKLVHQLARPVQGLELDADVVKTQVGAFKTRETEILKKIYGAAGGRGPQDSAESNPVAKLLEEMKALPSRVSERLIDAAGPFSRRRALRRFHPMMFEELMHMAGEPGDPVGILMAASLVREDAPWLYELAMEVYRAVKSGDPEAIDREMGRLQRFSEFTAHGPFVEEFARGNEEAFMFFREFPHMLQHMLSRTRIKGKPRGHAPRPRPKPEPES